MARMHGIANNSYLDTLHSDYAVIITLAPEHRSMTYSDGSDTVGPNWDFGLYPNPADDVLNVLLPDDAPMNIAIYDLSGRRIRSWESVNGPRFSLSVGELSRGPYYVRVSDSIHSRVKQLIIR